jgi:ABC-2 type transport system permease protein
MIAAILRAQLWSMRMRGSRGAVFSGITAFVWYGFWYAISYAIYSLARRAGPETLETGLPTGLLLMCLYWQVVPVISASLGSALDLRKLLIYPAPHGKLFFVEVLLRLTTGAEMILVLAGGLLGMAVNPKTRFSAFALLAACLLYIAFNLLLASGMRSLLERLLARRHVRELVMFLSLMAVAVPRLLLITGARPQSSVHWIAAIQVPGLPWTAAADLILHHSLAASFLALGCWTAAAAWFGRTQFERNLRYDTLAVQATPLSGRKALPSSWSERFYRLPAFLFRDPLAALIEKELRSLARTPRFRMVFVMGFSFGLMFWLPLVLGRPAERSEEVASNFLVIVCVYALTLLGQVTYWNCFGFDRSAAQIYFAVPQPISRTLLGKNIASMVFVYAEVLILSGFTVVLHVTVGPGKVLETIVVIAVCALYMLGFGNVSSVQYPRALKPERVSQGGASSRMQGLIFLLYPLALLPVGLAYLARYAFQSQIAFAAVLSFAAALGGVLYRLSLESAVNTATRHRERILRDLSRGDGPIASD